MSGERRPLSTPIHVAQRLAESSVPAWLLAILRVPLVAKLAGANAVIAIAAFVAAAVVHRGGAAGESMLIIFAIALVGSVLANVGLVVLALRPLADLETTAKRIWRGDVTARVPDSLLADRDLQRVGGALNVLLDGLTADRARLRELAARVIRAGDEERSYIARELHDSSAQSLAAMLMELSVAVRETGDPAAAEPVHPRVLDDLGLGAALQHLAREAEARSTVRIEVVVEDSAGEVTRSVSSVLYRVAQEALNNALRHANATTVLLRAAVTGRVAQMEISDDGVGFRLEEAEARRPGMGLFTMRERIALLDGALDVESAPGRGTRIVARVPLVANARGVVSAESAGT